MLSSLANKLAKVKGLDERSLRYIRQFYQTYNYIENSIWGTLSPDLQKHLIRGTMTPKLGKMSQNSIHATAKQSSEATSIPPETLLKKLAFSHFIELIKISDPQKRLFYELECIKGTWSVRELKRQINSLYYERSSMSKSPVTLSQKTLAKTAIQPTHDLIKDVYIRIPWPAYQRSC